MAEISKYSIQDSFQKMTAVPGTIEYGIIINNAYRKLCRLTEGRQLNEDEAARCEYAAAAEAAYSYALERAAREEMVFSETGAVKRRCADLDVAAAAKLRRDNAFAQLAGIVRDDEFTFRAIEG